MFSRRGTGWAFTRATLALVEAEVEASDRADLPEMIGELEKTKAQAWQKLSTPQSQAATPDRVLNVREAAARLGSTRASLYRKWKRLRLAYIDPLDGKLKFSEAALDAYIARQRRA